MPPHPTQGSLEKEKGLVPGKTKSEVVDAAIRVVAVADRRPGTFVRHPGQCGHGLGQCDDLRSPAARPGFDDCCRRTERGDQCDDTCQWSKASQILSQNRHGNAYSNRQIRMVVHINWTEFQANGQGKPDLRS